jgi:sugar-specific transcriptional regulator TrmB
MKNIERFYFEKTQQYVQTIDQYSLIIDRLRKKEAQNNLLAHNNNKILEQLNQISTSLSKQQLISKNQQKQFGILKDLITEQESLTRLIDILAMEILRLKNELHALRQGKTKTAQRKTLSVRQEGIIRKAFRYYRVHGFKKTVKRVLLEFGRK